MLRSAAFFVSVLAFVMSSGQALGNSQLNVYTTRHYEADDLLVKQFEKETGTRVKIVQIKEPAQLVARAESEKENIQADLLVTTDVGSLWRASEAGIFQPISSQVLKASVPQAFRSDKDLWVGFALRARLLAYNNTKLKPEQVANIEDLAAAELKGRVLVRSSNHVYNQSLAASLLTSLGGEGLKKWASGVTQNLARKPQGGDTDQIKAIAASEGDVAIINSYYAARLLESSNPKDKELMKHVSLIFPNQQNRGLHVNISGGGITRYAKNPKSAERFLEYLVTKEAQQLIVDSNKEYPVRDDVLPPVSLRVMGKPKIDLLGLKDVGKNTPQAVRILGEVGWR